MNLDLQDLLARRADTVEPPVFDPLVVVAGANGGSGAGTGSWQPELPSPWPSRWRVTALVVDRGGDPTVPVGPSRSTG